MLMLMLLLLMLIIVNKRNMATKTSHGGLESQTNGVLLKVIFITSRSYEAYSAISGHPIIGENVTATRTRITTLVTMTQRLECYYE